MHAAQVPIVAHLPNNVVRHVEQLRLCLTVETERLEEGFLARQELKPAEDRFRLFVTDGPAC